MNNFLKWFVALLSLSEYYHEYKDEDLKKIEEESVKKEQQAPVFTNEMEIK